MEYRYAKHPLLYKNGVIKGFGEVLAYLIDRYSSVEERLLETFRYVTCDSRNLDTFSYEYGSILRDAGSIFGSAMDKLAKGTDATPQNRKSNQYTIVDYKEWLLTNVPGIPQMSMELDILRKNKFLIPFSALANSDTKIESTMASISCRLLRSSSTFSRSDTCLPSTTAFSNPLPSKS